MALRAVHLCAGYGGFELGLRLAGIPARTVAYVERDSYAASAHPYSLTSRPTRPKRNCSEEI